MDTKSSSRHDEALKIAKRTFYGARLLAVYERPDLLNNVNDDEIALTAYIERSRAIEAERDELRVHRLPVGTYEMVMIPAKEFAALRAVAEAADSLMENARYDADFDVTRYTASDISATVVALAHAREVGVDL